VPIIEAKASTKSRVMVVFTDVKNDTTLDAIDGRSGDTGSIIWDSATCCFFMLLVQSLRGNHSIQIIRDCGIGQTDRGWRHQLPKKAASAEAASRKFIIFSRSVQQPASLSSIPFS
jgi:hypothetical protein